MKYVIVGGVAGGATAAARIRRNTEKAEIILFERGEYISYANCGLPYYIGGVIQERDRLFVQTPEAFSLVSASMCGYVRRLWQLILPVKK